MATLLLVDDDADLSVSLSSYLLAKGHQVVCESRGEDALRRAETESFDLVLLDLGLGRLDGMTVLTRIRQSDPALPVVMMTGNARISTAVEAIKLGAHDYIPKPFAMDQLLHVINRTIQESSLSREVEAMRYRLREAKRETSVLGDSAALRAVLDQIRKVAPTDLTVVLQGESGSGKEVMARLIDQLSGRRDGPFVAVDCGTLQEALAESELFGHEKGAFTGADERTLGQFEIAYRGTLFLDEIGNLSPAVQTKLLRVLQERKIRRVGGKKDIPVDVRIIAASNRDLRDAVKSGEFREDLFHRLNQFVVHIPPLRERKEDIPLLVGHFLLEAARLLRREPPELSPSALGTLQAYDWPGNVRELKNAVTRAVLLAGPVILPEHFSLAAADSSLVMTGEIKSLREARAEKERDLIVQVLRECRGNRTKAADKLGIHRTALYDKLKKYQIF